MVMCRKCAVKAPFLADKRRELQQFHLDSVREGGKLRSLISWRYGAPFPASPNVDQIRPAFEGFVELCERALPGQRLVARVLKKKRGFAEAYNLRTVSVHNNAVAAPCQQFGDCGGCKTQNLAYHTQRHEKEPQVHDLIARIGGFGFSQPDDPTGSYLKPIVLCSMEYRYRNKMEFSFGTQKWVPAESYNAPSKDEGNEESKQTLSGMPQANGDNFSLGGHASERFNRILPINECLLQHKQVPSEYGVELEEKHWGSHRAKCNSGYRTGTAVIEQTFSWWPLRQYSTKASPSTYRSSIIEKGTKNMPVTPKKWKRTLPSKEVLNAVYSLRRVKRNADGIKEVLRKYVSRLLKLEMMLVLSELQRLEEWHLSHQVFNMIRKESWYRPDVYLFQTMVQLFGRNKQIKLAEKMFEELEDEGLHPDDSIRRELLRSYVICDMMPEAIQLYKEILKLGKDQAARSILFHGLSPEDKEELAHHERQEGIDWSYVEKRR
ncbi:hypothetical protein R1flu_021082 [Riccia fluitans]|uniref:Pentatricopeptide repeat-containing protein n=1 Tax=Riccia fluitans TaxID=41844 RepID=A0ABD1ZS14_9MARC